jgi:hypothetical protein
MLTVALDAREHRPRQHYDDYRQADQHAHICHAHTTRGSNDYGFHKTPLGLTGLRHTLVPSH